MNRTRQEWVEEVLVWACYVAWVLVLLGVGWGGLVSLVSEVWK